MNWIVSGRRLESRIHNETRKENEKDREVWLTDMEWLWNGSMLKCVGEWVKAIE